MPNLPMYLVASMRNECPYLLEFVSHYLTLGFKNIVIATNDNTDDTLVVLERIAATGAIRVFDNQVEPGGQPQKQAYRRVLREFRAEHPAFTVYPVDADELLFLYKHETIDDYLDFIGDVDAIALNWKFFGSNGHLTRPPGLVMEAYDKHGDPSHRGSRTIKSISHFRGNVRGFGIHFPHFRDLPGAQIRFADGSPLPPENLLRKHAHQVWADAHFDVAAVHHYGIKSLEEFRLKKSRGRGTGKPGVRHSDEYFEAYDRNDVLCEVPADWIAKVRTKMTELFVAANLGDRYDKTYFGI